MKFINYYYRAMDLDRVSKSLKLMRAAKRDMNLVGVSKSRSYPPLSGLQRSLVDKGGGEGGGHWCTHGMLVEPAPQELLKTTKE